MILADYDGSGPRLLATLLFVTPVGRQPAFVTDASFEIDFRSSRTILSARLLDLEVPPLDDLQPISGVPGVEAAYEVPVLIGFESDDGRAAYQVRAFLGPGPNEANRLGRDILNRWLMVFDPANGTLLIEPIPEAP